MTGRSITPYGTALDLGWCVMRDIDDETWIKILGVVPHRREIARRAAYAGLTWRQYVKLSPERQEDLRLGALWMSRQFDPPMVGTPIAE